MFRYTSLIVLCLAADAAAQILPDSTIELPEAVVESEADARLTTARLNRIDARALESAPNANVADVLARTGTVYIQRYGPSGLATASFRGAGSKNTAIYLDGLLLSDPQSNEIDLAVIPLVMIESIDVQHGAGSSSASSGSIGGSVFLNTFKPASRSLKITGEGGHYGKMRLGATGGTTIGQFRVAAAGEVSEFEGDYPYTNTTLIGAPEQTREGADKSLASAFVSAEYTSDSHQITASGWLNSVERGLPGPGNAPPAGARQWDDLRRGWIRSHHVLDRWVVDLSAVATSNELRYVNQSTGSNDTTIANSASFAADAERVIGSNLLLAVGLKTGPDWSPEVTEWRTSLSSEATWALGNLFILPSILFESRSSSFGDAHAVVPRLGFALHLDRDKRFFLKSNLGRSYRIPSFLERFWVPGGNPDLGPEDGWSIDGGIAGKMGRTQPFEFEATAFFTQLENQIAWFPSFAATGLQIWTPYNVGRTHTYGFEYSAELVRRIGLATLHVGLSGLLNRTIDLSDENAASYERQLRYVPQATNGVFVRADLEPFSFDISGRHVGPRYVTSDESMQIDGFFVLDALVSYRIPITHASTRIALQAENLFDADYSVIRFYPMPPRMVTIRLDVEFK